MVWCVTSFLLCRTPTHAYSTSQSALPFAIRFELDSPKQRFYINYILNLLKPKLSHQPPDLERIFQRFYEEYAVSQRIRFFTFFRKHFPHNYFPGIFEQNHRLNHICSDVVNFPCIGRSLHLTITGDLNFDKIRGPLELLASHIRS